MGEGRAGSSDRSAESSRESAVDRSDVALGCCSAEIAR